MSYVIASKGEVIIYRIQFELNSRCKKASHPIPDK